MTQQNRALRLHSYGTPEGLQVDEIPVPSPREAQVVVRVKAAGVNPLDQKIHAGWLRGGFPLELPAVLGMEFAGVVAAVGPGASRLKVGDRVLGTAPRLGAYADFIAVEEASLALFPAALDDVQAASLPVAGLTAWQMLRAAGELRSGQRILVHGASGGVGGFAVQVAKAAGATVFATASSENVAYVAGLGADVVIDRLTERFEERATSIDLVIDGAGGELLDRSWSVLAPEGVIVSIAAMDIAAKTPAGRRGLFFRMQGDPGRLQRLAEDVAEGRLRSTIAAVVPLSGLAAVISGASSRRAPGKVVVDLTL
jgi:NADPH:quinone reductase-like Zn-dependent oxidoreductase